MSYVEAQYSTEGAKDLIRGWLRDWRGDSEGVARYMRDSLRIGGIKSCRALILAANQSGCPQGPCSGFLMPGEYCEACGKVSTES